MLTFNNQSDHPYLVTLDLTEQLSINFWKTTDNSVPSACKANRKMKHITLLLVAALAFAGLVRSSNAPAAESPAVSPYDDESSGPESGPDIFDLY